MKTLIIAGSPRKGMYSDRIADMIKEAKGGEIVRLREKKIAPCRGCDMCRKNNGALCVFHDDMDELYDKFTSSGTVVLLSPVYWWQVTAQTKLFIDRLYALPLEAWKGRRYVVILNGGAESGDVEFRILHDAFKEMFDYLGVDSEYLGIGTSDDKAYAEALPLLRSFIEEKI